MNTSNNMRIIRKPEVLSILAISKSTLHERINDGFLPPPIKLGERAVGWLENEIQQTLKAMAAGIQDDLLADYIVTLVNARKVAWDELRR
ncbi:AlpA family phage regulatory protein [Shewanella sp. S1-58-MNA-CIBAN-0166]|uniref:helix-turn-helix transcriptional regulator n=1 Tax=Shewanella sp. S1-58-MNA-CIBAN-0166 TaxID=3140467 RepID=UPI00331743E9